MKKVLCALLLATPTFAAVEVDEGSVYSSKPVHLKFEKGTFSVESEDGKFDIARYNVKGSVKGLSDDIVERLLRSGNLYFKLNYESQTLDSNLRMLGGMPPKPSGEKQGNKDSEKAFAIMATAATTSGFLVAGPVGAGIGFTGAVVGHVFNHLTGRYEPKK